MRAKQFKMPLARHVVAAAGLVVVSIASPATAAPPEADGLRSVADAAEFQLGAAVDADLLGDAGYQELLTENVTIVSTLDELSFAVVQPARGTFDFSQAEAVVDFAVEHGLPVRGHDLITPDRLPAWITEGAWTPETLRDVLVEHVTTVVGHFAERNPGVVTQWDVVARAVLADGSRRPSLWQTVIGDDYVNAAFAAARAADPAATLFYDDFYDDFSITQEQAVGAESVAGGANAAQTTCEVVAKCVGVQSMVAGMLEAGVPVDGIGFQAHLYSPDPADFSQFSSWVVDLGLDWAFTEFDVPLPVTEVGDASVLEFQASVYGAALQSCVDSPSCNTFVTWGITDRLSPATSEASAGFGSALWFDGQDAPKPAHTAIATALSSIAPEPPPETTPSPETSTTIAETDTGSSSGIAVLVIVGAALVVGAAIVMRRRRS